MRSAIHSRAVLVEQVDIDAGSTSSPPTRVRVHPFQFDPTIAVDVPLVRWPDETGAREEFERRRIPCLLVVGGADGPPREWTELEDWIREPLRDRELRVRGVTVARRADAYCRPVLDRHGRVTFRDRTVEVPRSQRAIVARLLERPGEVVRDREIAVLFGEVSASTHAEAVKTALRRIKEALEPLGLRLTRVRRAGYLLDRSP